MLKLSHPNRKYFIKLHVISFQLVLRDIDKKMPKCATVVALVVITNVITLAIYSTFHYDFSPTEILLQPLPQPGQLNQIVQTGRVIQAVMEEKTEESENLFEKRQNRVLNYCQQLKEHPTSPFTNDPSKLFVLKERNVVWCPVFKAGSSTWLSTLVDLSSKSKVNKNTFSSKKSFVCLR